MPTFPKISYVCPIAWADMRGDERERFCAKCRRTVVNFSLLTETQRRKLLEEEEAKPGSLCVAYYQRLSGEFVSPEQPLTPRESRRIVQIGATVTLAAALTMTANQAPLLGSFAESTRQRYERYRVIVTLRAREMIDQVADCLGFPRKPPPVTMLMGMMVCPPPSAPSVSPPSAPAPNPAPPAPTHTAKI